MTAPWLSLAVAVFVTVMLRIAAVGVAKSQWVSKIDPDTMSRAFPLIILFILVVKELLGSFTAQPANYGESYLKAFSVVAVVLLHLWKRNFFLSVIGGTVLFVAVLNLI